MTAKVQLFSEMHPLMQEKVAKQTKYPSCLFLLRLTLWKMI